MTARWLLDPRLQRRRERSMEIARLRQNALVARMAGPARMLLCAGRTWIGTQHLIGRGNRRRHDLSARFAQQAEPLRAIIEACGDDVNDVVLPLNAPMDDD